MKILFTLTYYTPHWTGLTEHARRLAEALVQAGHTVQVLAVRHDPSLSETEVIAGVQVLRTGVIGRFSRTLLSPLYLVSYLHLVLRNDVVICYTPCMEVLPVSFLAKLLRKRLLLVHNGDLILPQGRINTLIQSVFDITTYLSGVFADRLIAYTDDYATHSRFLQHFRHKTTAIFPLFEKHKMLKMSKKFASYKQTHSSYHVVGFSGRFVEEKGFDILLRAIPLVVQQHPHIRFVFAGEVYMAYERFFEQQQSLYQSVSAYLHSFGLLSQAEMKGFFELLDVFVLPSRSDCLALVQVEAMLHGVPVVATDIPGARVPVRETGMGVLVPPESPEALAAAILMVVKKKQLYLQKQKQLANLVDREQSLRRFEELLQ